MTKLGIIFGGRSGEHEVSILSAASLAAAIDTSKYELALVGVNRRGGWFSLKGGLDGLESLDDPRVAALIPPSAGAGRGGAEPINPGELARLADFAFPVMHGPYGEDGRPQGLFEMLGIPYAGCGVAASAVAMDKILTKDVWIRAGLPVCRHAAILEEDYARDADGEIDRVSGELGYPLFVKPANMGSSVGICKAKSRRQLKEGAEAAFRHDARLIIEECVDCRELETGVLGNAALEVAAVGEILPEAEFYDYDSKYRSAGTKLIIPADIPGGKAAEIKSLAARAYKALNCKGFARVDFFMDKKTGRVLLNEINTIPGFTKFSMFPLLWRHEGVSYRNLVERIIGLGYERHNAENNR